MTLPELFDTCYEAAKSYWPSAAFGGSVILAVTSYIKQAQEIEKLRLETVKLNLEIEQLAKKKESPSPILIADFEQTIVYGEKSSPAPYVDPKTPYAVDPVVVCEKPSPFGSGLFNIILAPFKLIALALSFFRQMVGYLGNLGPAFLFDDGFIGRTLNGLCRCAAMYIFLAGLMWLVEFYAPGRVSLWFWLVAALPPTVAAIRYLWELIRHKKALSAKARLVALTGE